MKFKNLLTDKKLDEKGVWVDIGDGGSVLVGRVEGRAYRELRDKLLRKHQIQLQVQSLSSDLLNEINLQVESQTILLGLRGVEDENDKLIKWSVKKGYEMLEESDIFRSIVLRAANDLNHFRKGNVEKAREALVGNSGGDSDTAGTESQ